MQLGYSAGDEAFRTDLRAWFEGHYPRFKARWPHAHDPNDLRWRRAWEDHVCQAGWAGLDWPLAYGGKAWPLTRLAIFHEEQARIGAPLGVNIIGIPLDAGGMRMDLLSNALDDLKKKGVRAKFIYTIPTVQNPTSTIMPIARREEMLRLATAHGVPIFVDDCYADLIWSGVRPPALYAMTQNQNVIHIGSFSKSIAPALRVGFIVAPWAVMSRLLPLKTDGGSGALEQMVLAEFCVKHFAKHVPALRKGLRAKLETLMESVKEHFGDAATFDDPQGGIFLWVTLPENVDTQKLFQPAMAAGVAINPGAEWSVNKAYGSNRMRLGFASPTHEEIHQGVAALAEVCRREFGVPK